MNSCVRANDVVEGETHERRVQLQLVVARVLQQKDPCVELPGETLTNGGIRDSVDDHQTANARPMADAGAAKIIPESELTPAVLAGLLREWLQSRDQLQQRAARARALSCPDSLGRITEICLEQAGVAA